jgi:hypothetical protein
MIGSIVNKNGTHDFYIIMAQVGVFVIAHKLVC